MEQLEPRRSRPPHQRIPRLQRLTREQPSLRAGTEGGLQMVFMYRAMEGGHGSCQDK